MKKIFSLFLGLLLLTNISKGQTTWQDYRYITKGLKDDLDMGKGIKAGFTTEKIGSESSVTQQGIQRSAQLYYFRKQGDNHGFIVHCWDSKGNYSYFCIPTSDASSEIWSESFNAISRSGQEWQLVFAWALARITSQKL